MKIKKEVNKVSAEELIKEAKQATARKAKHARRGPMIAAAIITIIAVLVILSRTEVIKSPPALENVTETHIEQADETQEKQETHHVPEIETFSNKEFGISFSYPKEFMISSYISKDLSLTPPKIYSNALQAPIKITKTPLAAGATLDKYAKGTFATLGYLSYPYEKITLSDGTEAALLNREMPRADNPKAVYLLIFVYQDKGYYMYYMAPVAEYRQYIKQIEDITASIRILK